MCGRCGGNHTEQIRFLNTNMISTDPGGREKVYDRRAETICALACEKNSLYRDKILISRYINLNILYINNTIRYETARVARHGDVSYKIK